MIEQYRQVIGLAGAACMLLIAYRLWVAYQAEVLKQKVARLLMRSGSYHG